jgi:hypothetical protein
MTERVLAFSLDVQNGDCGAAALVAHSVVVCPIPLARAPCSTVARQPQLGTVTALECKIPRFVGRPFELWRCLIPLSSSPISEAKAQAFTGHHAAVSRIGHVKQRTHSNTRASPSA